MPEEKRGIESLFTKDRPTPQAHQVNVDHVRKAIGEEGLTRAAIAEMARGQIAALLEEEVGKIISRVATKEKIEAMVQASIDKELSRFASNPQTLKNVIADMVGTKLRAGILEKLSLTIDASAKIKG